MFNYRLKRIVQEEGANTVAYVDVLDEQTGETIRTVCVPYETPQKFLDELKKRASSVLQAAGRRITMEEEIRNLLTVNRTALNEAAAKEETKI